MPSVEAMFIARKRGEPMEKIDHAVLQAARGIEGEWHFDHIETWGRWSHVPRGEHDPGKEITLIEAEAIEAVLAEHGVDYSDGSHRRNVVVRGVRLNELTHRKFRVGNTLLRGERPCSPCGRLDRLTNTTAKLFFKNRAGLRCRIVEGGELNIGDVVEVLS